MRRLPRITTAILFVVLSCSPHQSHDELLGRWNCAGSSDGFSFTGDVEYVANGRTSQTFEVRGTTSGNRLEFSSVSHGTWSIESGQLVETVDKFTVVTLAVNGQQVPVSQLSPEFSKAFIGTSTGSEIERLTHTMLITRNGPDHVSCSRD